MEGELQLRKAMGEALGRVDTFAAAQTHTGLAGDIDRLQQSAPELLSKNPKPPAPPLESLAAVHDAGVTTQATVLFDLLSALHTLDNSIDQTNDLTKQATDLRTPLLKILRSTVARGQTLATIAPVTAAPVTPSPAAAGAPGAAHAGRPGAKAAPVAATPTGPTLAETRKQFDQLTATFQVLSSATLPLSQELVLLAAERGSLTTWRAAVDVEYKSVLRSLLVRVVTIAVALGILALISSIWSRATVRYVNDLRRRRQLLFVRRAVIGFLSGLVVLFGFVTQFSSLATFAGFIS